MTNNIDKQTFGQKGATYVTDGESAAGDFCALQCLSDTAFTSVTWPALTGTFPTVTLAAGTVIYGQVASFTVNFGSVLAYKQV
jgi:hypothetical protein